MPREGHHCERDRATADLDGSQNSRPRQKVEARSGSDSAQDDRQHPQGEGEGDDRGSVCLGVDPRHDRRHRQPVAEARGAPAGEQPREVRAPQGGEQVAAGRTHSARPGVIDEDREAEDDEQIAK